MANDLLTVPDMVDLTRPHPVRDYLDPFRADFARRDQLRWVEVYLRGLLADLPRKNIETVARHLVLPSEWGVEDPKQALQNFLNQSPWDESKIWRRYRARVADRLAHAQGVFVIQELPFVKQGKHSVGVHRQFSWALGEKTNCQIAIGLHYVSPAGDAPLALRLYLPANWIGEPERLDAAGVPFDRRRKIGRAELALELIDEALAEGALPVREIALPPDLAGLQDLTAELAVRGLSRSGDKAQRIANASLLHMKRDLGLDHFEGRSWRGFHHHACLVMLAFGFELISSD